MSRYVCPCGRCNGTPPDEPQDWPGWPSQAEQDAAWADYYEDMRQYYTNLYGEEEL